MPRRTSPAVRADSLVPTVRFCSVAAMRTVSVLYNVRYSNVQNGSLAIARQIFWLDAVAVLRRRPAPLGTKHPTSW
jgi:hypothetical protein